MVFPASWSLWWALNTCLVPFHQIWGILNTCMGQAGCTRCSMPAGVPWLSNNTRNLILGKRKKILSLGSDNGFREEVGTFREQYARPICLKGEVNCPLDQSHVGWGAQGEASKPQGKPKLELTGINPWLSSPSPLPVSQEQPKQKNILVLFWLGSGGDLCASAVTWPFVTPCARQANCPGSAIRVIRESSVLSCCNPPNKTFHLNQSPSDQSRRIKITKEQLGKIFQMNNLCGWK